jgi:hypothetical protein
LNGCIGMMWMQIPSYLGIGLVWLECDFVSIRVDN